MAGDWLKWTKGLTRKIEVAKMAAELGVAPAMVAGMCMQFWEWLDDNVSATQCDASGSASVDMTGVNLGFIDLVGGMSGFGEALILAGWLAFEGGMMRVPNFARHNGRPAKDRALSRDRSAACRRRAKESGRSRSRVTGEEEASAVAAAPTEAEASPQSSRVHPVHSVHQATSRAEDTPCSLDELVAYAAEYPISESVPVKPDPGFCEWWWDAQESVGWLSPPGARRQSWRAEFRKSWRGRYHKEQALKTPTSYQYREKHPNTTSARRRGTLHDHPSILDNFS